ncbi:hypothetical protein [Tahibacter sp.]|uniref:hypothetical protein n=1 Tax=Tahibacter sp. TaxID=2056211 RepID=UPI0028C37A05|nr:hypothetical protein [Tahibacter sp.]
MSFGRIQTFLLSLLLGAMACAYAYINFYPMWLSVELVSDKEDITQVFHSANGMWNEQESASKPLASAVDQINFDIPAGSMGSGVRFDPGQRPTEYHLLSVRWQRGAMSRQVEPATIVNLRPDQQQLRVDGQRVLVTVSDNDAQVMLPAPSRTWLVFSLWPLFLVVLASLAIARMAWRDRAGAVDVATLYLVMCAGVYGIATIAGMPELPFMDDWRYYVPGAFQLTGSNYRWLTMVGNDTYFLTGQLLDFVALRVSNASFEAVRWTGIGVLLVYLVAMRRSIIVAGGPAAGTAVAIALIAGVLGETGYWGGTGIAYHQFLPVMFSVLVFAYVGKYNERASALTSTLVLVALCAAAGLAYISGGLMLACAGAGLLVAHADRSKGLRTPAIRAGITVFVTGTALLLLQIWMVSTQQGSLADHNHAAASVYPNDRRFPIFFAAQFGRAAGYPGTNVTIDAILLVVCLLPALLLVTERIWRGLFRGIPAQRPLMVGLSIGAAAMAATYAAAVAFGRAGFLDAAADPVIITTVAKARFHFCTIAALLPLIWLGWVELALRWQERRVAMHGYLIAALVALVLLVPKSTTTWSVVEDLRKTNEQATEGAYCAMTQFADSADTQPVICEMLVGLKLDMRPTLELLKSQDRALYRDLQELTERAARHH